MRYFPPCYHVVKYNIRKDGAAILSVLMLNDLHSKGVTNKGGAVCASAFTLKVALPVCLLTVGGAAYSSLNCCARRAAS
jgi:hypothetical protein